MKKVTQDYRTSVSLTLKVWGWAEELMADGGYNNFSAFLAELIREARRHKAGGADLNSTHDPAALIAAGKRHFVAAGKQLGAEIVQDQPASKPKGGRPPG